MCRAENEANASKDGLKRLHNARMENKYPRSTLKRVASISRSVFFGDDFPVERRGGFASNNQRARHRALHSPSRPTRTRSESFIARSRCKMRRDKDARGREDHDAGKRTVFTKICIASGGSLQLSEEVQRRFREFSSPRLLRREKTSKK